MKRRKSRGERCQGRKARRTCFGLLRQCGRVLPHPPTVADRCFRFRGNIGVVGRISRFLRECACSTLWKAVVEKELPILNAPGTVSYTGQSFSKRAVAGVKKRFSTLGRAFVCRGQPFLEARAGRCLQRKEVVQSAGAPGRFRAVRPTAASRRDSLPPSSAAGVVQVRRQ